jgi:SAM-dependent methyltransferase
MMRLRDHPREHLEMVGCKICGEKQARQRFAIQGFPILRCVSCSMSYVSPRLNAKALRQLYSDERYFKSENSLVSGYTDYVSDKENILRTYKKRFDHLLKVLGKSSLGKVLDVGCATGFSLEYGLAAGWDVHGVEISEFAARQAQTMFGNRVHHGTLESAHFPSRSFDGIIIWDFIEHAPDPLAILAQLNGLLVAGGWISIITPDCESLAARCLGRFWMEYAKPTEHIYYFSRKTLALALSKTGFECLDETTAGKYVGLDFLANRFRGYLPFLKNKEVERALGRFLPDIYIDIKDKMMVTAKKTNHG